MRGRTRFALSVVAVLAVVVATAVSAAPRARTAAAPSGTITLSWITELRPGMEPLIKNFEKAYPNVKVDVTYTPFVTYQSLLLTQLQSRSASDLIWVDSGGGLVGVFTLGAKGRLLDLTGSPWQKQIDPALRKFLLVKGRLLAFTLPAYSESFAANTTVMKAAGAKIPTTFQELLADCGKIKAIGKIPIAWNGEIAAGNYYNEAAVAWVYSKDPNWTLHKIQHKTSFAATPGWRKVFQGIVQMKEAGCFSPAAADPTISISQTAAQLAAGQAAMTTGGLLDTSAAKGINPSVKIDNFAFPGDTANQTKIPVSAAINVGVNKATKNATLAKLFLNFLASPKQQDVYAKVGGGLTGKELSTGRVPPELKSLGPLLKQHRTAPVPNAFFPDPAFKSNLGKQVQGLLTGQTTPDSIIAWADKNWK